MHGRTAVKTDAVGGRAWLERAGEQMGRGVDVKRGSGDGGGRWDRGGSTRWARGSQTGRRRTIRWSAGRRRGGRGEACSPFRARLSAHFRRPRLAGGGEDGKRFRSSQRLPPSSPGRLLPLPLSRPVAISYPLQLYTPPLLSAQAASALSSPCSSSPALGQPSSPHTILASPRCHRPTLTQASDVPFRSIVFGLPHRRCEAAISGAPY